MKLLRDDGDEHVGGDGTPDLSLDRVLAGSQESLDAKVLLDPLEEQFDLPAALVQGRNGQGRQGRIVGQKHQRLAGLRAVVRDASGRRVRFKDPESGKTLVFLTNNTALPALTICALYKSRWQVELFFQWIKQHLRIKRFLGTSENAVKTQIWCAIATYVPIAIVKKELQLSGSLYTCLQILSVSVFEKTPISRALNPTRSQTEPDLIDNQLLLFDF